MISSLLPPLRPPGRALVLLAVVIFGGARISRAQQFSELVIFGDSLSDVGNIADRTEDDVFVRYPGSDFNYTNGRFTDGSDTSPKARKIFGVWHEQLALNYLGIAKATPSEEGGLDYAFGGAKTIAGVTNEDLASDPFFGESITIDIDNMGKQVDDYLGSHVPKADGLFVVWGGGNDLFDNPDSATVAQTVNNVSGIITRLAQAGARSFIVPNVPPLGLVPNYKDDPTKAALLNQAASDYRTLLATNLDQTEANLVSQGITVTIYRLDIYAAFMHFVENPAAWGFTNITDSAQDIRGKPNKYLFWDGIHPTTVGHSYIAAAAYTLISGKPVILATSVINQIPEEYGSNAQFYITRFGEDLSSTVNVPFTLSGTATNGEDYAPLIANNRKLRRNKRYRNVILHVIDDDQAEDDESIILTLTPTDNFTPAPLLSSPSITILHNDE